MGRRTAMAIKLTQLNMLSLKQRSLLGTRGRSVLAPVPGAGRHRPRAHAPCRAAPLGNGEEGRDEGGIVYNIHGR